MYFDYGDILTRAWQITWKHKVFWGLLALPMGLSILTFPFIFAFLPIVDGNLYETASVILTFAGVIFIILLSIASFGLYVISTTSVTLGIVRAERGEGSLSFMGLLKDGLNYFWPQLGALLIVQLSIGAIFSLFFGFVFASTMVTMGMAAICLQPIIILLTPLMFLMVAVIEAAQTAVISEELGAVDALKRALQVVRGHIWKYIIIALIVYFGSTIISSLLTFPLFIPFFFFPFFIESGGQMSNQFLLIFGILFTCIFFPFMTLISVFTQTLMKASLDLTYLRLTDSRQKTENQVIFSEENLP